MDLGGVRRLQHLLLLLTPSPHCFITQCCKAVMNYSCQSNAFTLCVGEGILIIGIVAFDQKYNPLSYKFLDLPLKRQSEVIRFHKHIKYVDRSL